MGYVAVIGYDKKSSVVHLVQASDSFDYVADGTCKLEDAGRFALTSNLTPINFSIGANGEVKTDFGDFGRFSSRGSAVVLAEIKTRGGRRVIGYRLISCAHPQNFVNLKSDKIVKKEEEYGEEHFLQNGIIRNGVINCYPNHTYPVMELETQKKVPPKPVDSISKPKKQKVENQQANAPVSLQDFSKPQRGEMNLCKKNGVDPKLISNPKLSKDQMRVLWVSKSKGAMAEAFNNPDLSSDAMKFYADRLHDKKTVADCKELLQHPELDVDQLSELYQCICDGIDYSDLIGKSPTDIYTARETKCRSYWGSSKVFDPDYYDKALRVAMEIKGLSC